MVIQNMEFRKNQRRKFLHFRDTSYNPLWGEYIFGSEIHRCIYDNDAKDFHGQEQIFYVRVFGRPQVGSCAGSSLDLG
jgi:hypothetical protein